VIAVLLLLVMVWYLRPASIDSGMSVSDAQMQRVINTRCVACHAAAPTQPGFAAAPLGLVLENYEVVHQNAERIARTVQSKYMPIGNLTQMSDEERVLVASWYAQIQAQQ
ncbi:MAG: hypothetical protein GY770_26235, partial [Aestuariibacter sp.]|nr:hypothetical protein [Aestuariibacter sp.]